MQIKNNKGETFVSVIIMIIIISICLLSIMQILKYDNSYNYITQSNNYINLLTTNSYKILSKSNLTNFNNNDVLYIYKTGSTYQILTGAINSDYKYINELGEYINSGTYQKKYYSRYCLYNKDKYIGDQIKCIVE